MTTQQEPASPTSPTYTDHEDDVDKNKEFLFAKSADKKKRRGDAEGMTGQGDGDEVFKVGGEISYRAVSWPKAAAIFVKMQISNGALSVPSNVATLGAVPGGILVVAWGVLATYCGWHIGNFRAKHPHIHTLVDAAGVVGGPDLKEIAGIGYMLVSTLSSGITMLAISIAFNAITDHAICSVGFTAVGLAFTLIFASIPRFKHLGILTWFGAASIVTACLVISIAVSRVSRPAAAPVGVTDYGFRAVNHPGFIAGLTASNVLMISYGGTHQYLTATSEMINPNDYNKALTTSMGFTTGFYLIFTLIVYRYCGDYVANPALGSAGPVVKKVAYGVALPGMIISSCLYLHVGVRFCSGLDTLFLSCKHPPQCSPLTTNLFASLVQLAAKYVFVRILRDSKHLQSKTWKHYTVWFSTTTILSISAWVLAEGVPFFGSLLALLIIFVGPLCLSLPMMMWYHDNPRSHVMLKAFHFFVFLLGLFVGIAGVYAAIVQIRDETRRGRGVAFSCKDNSK